MVEVRRLNDKLWIRRIAEYVTNRQNEDGGYTFCQGAESNAQDTYYGLAILRLLDAKFPNKEKTISWLNELNIYSVFSTSHVTKALLLCNEEINSSLRKRILSHISSMGFSSSIEGFSEISSEFTTTFMTLELADLFGFQVNTDDIAKWLFHFKNEDGGFGSKNHSNINATYYAVASLNLIKQKVRDLHATLAFVRKCEKSTGGFTIIPMGLMPYMEHSYYGFMTLNLFDEKSRFPSQTIDFILKCQNKNGGFARSDLGISTFENTFQAISIMKRL